jgi:hypothetical protein
MSTRRAGSRRLQHVLRLLVAGALIVGSMAAQAALPLQGRDINGNRVPANDPSAVFEYDPNLNITWLRDWNVNGAHDWPTQSAWAASLTYFGGGWRLPNTAQPDPTCSSPFDPGGGFPTQYEGFDCTGSEMGYLFYNELGNGDFYALTNTGPFLNMQPDVYFSNLPYAPPNPHAPLTWSFDLNSGFQSFYGASDPYYAVAVRAGDVAPPLPPAPVPTLSPWGLAALAVLVALAVARRRPV